MTFAAPVFLVVGAALALFVAWLATRARHHRLAVLRRFAATRLVAALTASVSPTRRAVKLALVMAGVFLVGAALARPQVGYTWQTAKKQGIDLLFAIDTSKSMRAQDVAPDRLTRAKLAVSDLVRRFPADRIGLVAFAGDAFLQVPLTLDRTVFDNALMQLDTDVIPRPGTDVATALRTADEAFAGQAGSAKLLVLLTDGENLQGDALAAAQRAEKDGVTVFTVGVGSAAGDFIPVPDGSGGTTLLKDASGQPVRSRLDEDTLRAIAATTGGRYEPLGADGRGLERLYDAALAPLPKRLHEARQTRTPIERFQWPLAAGLLMLFLEGLIGDRRRTRSASRARRRATAAVSAALLVGLLAPGVAHASSPADAMKAYRSGAFGRAQALYQKALKDEPGDPVLTYNAGAAAYKGGDLRDALARFEDVVADGAPGVGEPAPYNLGNAYFRAGEAGLKGGDKDAARTFWSQAVVAYEDALRQIPTDVDAQHNLEVVKRRLAKLDEPPPDSSQPKQDQNQGGQGQQDPKNEDQQNKDQQGGQGQQDQDQKGQDQPQNGGQGQQDQDQKGQDQPQDGGQGQPDQAQKNQGGQGPQDQDQKGQDQQQQGAQGQQDREQKGQQPQPGDEDQGAEPQDAQAGGQEGAEPDPDQVRPAPGRLNRAEARALLDAHEHGRPIRALPMGPSGAGRPQNTPPPTKDW